MSTVAEQVHAEEVLSEALAGHVGEWVAVRDSKIIASAATLDELMAQVGDESEATTAFEVGDDADVACFF